MSMATAAFKQVVSCDPMTTFNVPIVTERDQ